LLPPGLTLVPVRDAPISILAVAWSAHNHQPAVAAFVSAARAATENTASRGALSGNGNIAQ
jgi:hypothetical protein